MTSQKKGEIDMTYATKLTPDVTDVLSRSCITATVVTLPNQLPRDLYVRVDKVLKAAGGKWDRKAGGHVFPRDPREVLGLALDTGAIVDQKRTKQQFFTPPGLAADIVALAEITPGMRVLEPSCGNGALALEATVAGGDVSCIEIDTLLVDEMRDAGQRCIESDFLDVAPTAKYLGGLFDRVVMNPPFTNEQDIVHVTHAFSFLKPGGRLVAVMSAGVKFHTSKQAIRFRALIQQCGDLDDLPENAFKESGTGVCTVLVTLDKPEAQDEDTPCTGCGHVAGASGCACDEGRS
jgi:predicted RNA methylase